MRFMPLFLVLSFVFLVALVSGGIEVTRAATDRPSASVQQIEPDWQIVFGPERLTRSTGFPDYFSRTLSHCGSGACRLVLVNGNPDGTRRVSSATVRLDGVMVVGQPDLNQQVHRVVREVSVEDESTLEVMLTSRPGSFVTISMECEDLPAALTIGHVSGSLLESGDLSLAIPLTSVGAAPAENVQVEDIEVPGGTVNTPALPLALGDMAVGETEIVYATLGGAFTPAQPLTATVTGTFEVDGATECFSLVRAFRIPPADEGSRELGSVDVGSQTVDGAPFDPQPPTRPERVNPAGWTVPLGPSVAFSDTSSATSVDLTRQALATGATGLRPRVRGALATPIEWRGNRGVGVSESTVAEPSGASGGGIVFATGNWFAAFSEDDGATFTELEPTTVFPADAVGFCCDQVVQYVPSIDRFIWLLQGNGYRLAVASPAQIAASNGTAWTYWNMTPQLFGQPAGTGLDYPDLAVGTNSLYMSWDAGAGCPAGCTSGFQVVRTSLAGLAVGGTITLEFTDPADGGVAWGSHLSQNTWDEIFWAGHNNNSQMRIFSLEEGSGTYFWRSRNVSSWPTNAPTSLTPDGTDWLQKNFNEPTGNNFPRNGVIGATRSGNQVWFAWTAGTNDRFPHAHVQMVSFDHVNDFSKSQQVQIWNDDYAFAYPSLATNWCSNEVGLSLEWGGGGNYENHVVGFWGDYVVYATSNSNVGATRFGDYVTLRQRPPTTADPGNLMDAFGYGLRTTTGGTTVDVRYTTFGRNATSCIVIR